MEKRRGGGFQRLQDRWGSKVKDTLTMAVSVEPNQLVAYFRSLKSGDSEGSGVLCRLVYWHFGRQSQMGVRMSVAELLYISASRYRST